MAGIAISCSQVTRLRASSNQGKRGSRLSELVKASQTEILDSHTEISEAIAAEDGVVNILAQEIGGNFFAAPITVACVFVLMSCMQVVLATVLHSYGHVHPVSFVKMICSTLFLNIVAFLLVLLMSRAVQSDDLILAVAKLDAFVKDCGKGLDWYLRLARTLSHVTSAMDCLAFAAATAIIINGAHFQRNLLIGLSKTIDCWCSDMLFEPDFSSGVRTWNSMQALIKCVGRELGPCFLALQICGFLGLISALAGTVSWLVWFDDGMAIVHVLATLPELMLFCVSAWLFAQGGALSNKCREVAPFVNELECGSKRDLERQYLVQFITDSRAGFIVSGIRVTLSGFLRQMATLGTLISGMVGVAIRRAI
ncbi:Metal transporter CNNM4 [Durusdinium trenchii]|uniref:Metal transporter CNNM4 n=1 Tax=Durusdinium trenchii TaxID=1381693 RepID=A0ABP0SJR2_9DINO